MENINWDKPQLVISKNNGVIILTTGKHDNYTSFAGTVVSLNGSKNHILYEYSIDWGKTHFELFTGTLIPQKPKKPKQPKVDFNKVQLVISKNHEENDSILMTLGTHYDGWFDAIVVGGDNGYEIGYKGQWNMSVYTVLYNKPITLKNK